MTFPILYSRSEDGARPVRVLAPGLAYELEGRVYGTAKDLLSALTGHPEGRHWSLDRYFGIGTHGPAPTVAQANSLDLFQTPGHLVVGEWNSSTILAPTLATTVATTWVTTRPTRTASTPIVVAERTQPRLGIDLEHRSGEVAKLLFAGFGRRIYAAGYDPDDVLQEVYRGLLARNVGTCPWDAHKSSFGHYVHMVCSCVLSNYHRKQAKVGEHEQVGVQGFDAEGNHALLDASTQAEAGPSSEAENRSMIEAGTDLVEYMRQAPMGTGREADLAAAALPLIVEGLDRKEIAERLGVSLPTLSKAMCFLKDQAREWIEH